MQPWYQVNVTLWGWEFWQLHVVVMTIDTNTCTQAHRMNKLTDTMHGNSSNQLKIQHSTTNNWVSALTVSPILTNKFGNVFSKKLVVSARGILHTVLTHCYSTQYIKSKQIYSFQWHFIYQIITKKYIFDSSTKNKLLQKYTISSDLINKYSPKASAWVS